MALQSDTRLVPADLSRRLVRLFLLSAEKIRALDKTWRPSAGTPVFTAGGQYTSRGWTEWTQGFQYGSALLQYEISGEAEFLELGRQGTILRMASHVSHVGVHDHGFNNVSTYGNLLRLMHEGRLAWNDRERECYELALKVSGAVQAARWTRLADGTGFIHSFNGAHSLFVDTIRSCRSLALAHRLGHVLMGEQDGRISLLQRLLDHAWNTARYSIYYGAGRDAYDVRGRTAHESVFNVATGIYRCPNSQQGYSPFTTWTRGLAWAICGFAELLEFLECLRRDRLTDEAEPRLGLAAGVFLNAALATADFYLTNSGADGVPMWDTGAPQLSRLPRNYLDRPANPFNPWEPVDSSAAAIAAQGLWRLGRYLTSGKVPSRRALVAPDGSALKALTPARAGELGRQYRQAALTIARTLMDEPYLSMDPRHQGLLLHSVYHRPNGWDHIARGQSIPNGESSMWGDYHLRELGVLLWREAREEPYLTFFGAVPGDSARHS